mgnify:CR=1 FL=1
MGTGDDNPDFIPFRYEILINCAHFAMRLLDKIYEGNDIWEREEAWFWEMTDMRALRRLLRQHYGKRRPNADEILAVMKEYKIRDKKKGKKK